MFNKPDFKLQAWIPNTREYTVAGAAWLKEDGSISIKLNPCIVLSWKDNIVIKLFPTANDRKGQP